MTICPFFHIGILVPDLEEAQDKFARLFGISFTNVASAEYEIIRPESGTRLRRSSRMCYSAEGPPYYELMQADSSDFFGPPETMRIHHVGLWTSDVGRAQQRAGEIGLRTDAETRDPVGRLGVFFTNPQDAYGIRFEFLPEAKRAGFEKFIASRDPRYLT